MLLSFKVFSSGTHIFCSKLKQNRFKSAKPRFFILISAKLHKVVVPHILFIKLNPFIFFYLLKLNKKWGRKTTFSTEIKTFLCRFKRRIKTKFNGKTFSVGTNK